MVLELHELTEVLGITIQVLNNQIEILSSQGAVDPMRTIDGGASPRILGMGRMLHEELSRNRDSYADDETVSPAVFTHSTDYRSVSWKGEQFTFTVTQSFCIEILHRNFRKGIPWVSSREIINHLHGKERSNNRIKSIFGDHPAFGTLIIRAQERRGMYRLNISG
ncbi:hypothetical protein M1N56_06415 [Dehalococcoidia bacterium]|nr:hypothetical protein [Dehalococcoidia bacterium]